MIPGLPPRVSDAVLVDYCGPYFKHEKREKIETPPKRTALGPLCSSSNSSSRYRNSGARSVMQKLTRASAVLSSSYFQQKTSHTAAVVCLVLYDTTYYVSYFLRTLVVRVYRKKLLITHEQQEECGENRERKSIFDGVHEIHLFIEKLSRLVLSRTPGRANPACQRGNFAYAIEQICRREARTKRVEPFS